MTDDQKSTIEGVISDLKQQRDELRLQLHLGSQELKDQWQKLDDKLAQLSEQYQPLKHAVEESSSDVWDAIRLLGGEVKAGFDRIRKSL